MRPWGYADTTDNASPKSKHHQANFSSGRLIVNTIRSYPSEYHLIGRRSGIDLSYTIWGQRVSDQIEPNHWAVERGIVIATKEAFHSGYESSCFFLILSELKCCKSHAYRDPTFIETPLQKDPHKEVLVKASSESTELLICKKRLERDGYTGGVYNKICHIFTYLSPSHVCMPFDAGLPFEDCFARGAQANWKCKNYHYPGLRLLCGYNNSPFHCKQKLLATTQHLLLYRAL